MKDWRKAWYTLIDTDDKGNADVFGQNYAAKLTYAAVGLAKLFAQQPWKRTPD